MMILVFGKNGSGKSRYAEQLVEKTVGKRYYFATMVAENDENINRIEKHRRQRADLDFTTVEEPWQVGNVEITSDAVVLLEDASNLFANLMFTAGGTAEQALLEIRKLKQHCRNLIVVAISGLSAESYSGETAAYIHGLNWLNERLMEECDAAVEVENGVVAIRKGNVDDLR